MGAPSTGALSSIRKILAMCFNKENASFLCITPAAGLLILCGNMLKIEASRALETVIAKNTAKKAFIKLYMGAKLLPILAVALHDISISRIFATCLKLSQREMLGLSAMSRKRHAPSHLARMHIKRAEAISRIAYCVVFSIFTSAAFALQALVALYRLDRSIFAATNVMTLVYILVPALLIRHALRCWIAYYLGSFALNASVANSARNFDIIKSFDLTDSSARETGGLVSHVSGADYTQKLNAILINAFFDIFEAFAVSRIVIAFAEGVQPTTLGFAVGLSADIYSALRQLYQAIFEISTYFYFFHSVENDPTYVKAAPKRTRAAVRTHAGGAGAPAIVFSDVCICGWLSVMNAEIARGEKIAIVGESGSGKSLLLEAVAGIVDYSGTISIEGDCAAGLESIAYAQQSVSYLAGSVMSNLKIGNTLQEPEIIEQCIEHGVHDAFEMMENGYQHVSATGGQSLSGGQRQRVHLMRELLKDAPVLLLDACFNNLNNMTATKILNKVLARESQTVLMVVTRRSQLALFDRIMLIDSNTVHIGTHDELRPLLQKLGS
ncbi:hypothetical protein PAPHI01_0502 [Pancytospora philotis]|nr:hypothetical protein PAPHI01_0502 [Pancytospora philotis]